MKKILLTLLLLFSLSLAASAETIVDELVVTNFSGINYETPKTWVSEKTSVTYKAQAYNTNGFQMRTSKSGCIICNTLNPNNMVISSIEITFHTTGGGVTLYTSDSAITSTNGLTSVGSTAANKTFTINSKFFAIVPTNNTLCRVSSVKVTYDIAAADVCPEPMFSVEDGADVYPGQNISVSHSNTNATCDFFVNGAKQDGLSYIVPENAQIGSTIELKAITTLTGADPESIEKSITVNVAERPMKVLFDVVNDYSTTFEGWFIGDVANNKSQEAYATIDGVTLCAKGRFTILKSNNEHTLRTYKTQGDVNAGSVTLTAPEGYYITSIEFTGDDLNNIGYVKFENTENDQTITSKTYTSTGTAKIKTIEVGYAAKTAVHGVSYRMSLNEGSLTIKYEVHVSHHYAGNNYKMLVTVDNGEAEEVVLGEPVLITEKENSPMRKPLNGVSGTDEGATHVIAGEHTVPGLADEAGNTYNVHMAVHVNGEEAHSMESPAVYTVTTGIEDVVVDGGEAAEYYNLQGVRVAQPEAGRIYIVRRGGKAVKELVK